MSKAVLLLLCLFFCLSRQQTLNPILLLPTETTQNVSVDYAFRFTTDTNVPHSASISLTFPFQYDPRELIKFTGCFFSNGTEPLSPATCTVNLRTFTINVGQIQAGTLTVFIKNIRNPVEASMSSHFSMRTLFRDVIITENLQFGKLPFTKSSIILASTGLVYNYENNLVEQGSTWVFRFTLAGTYPQNSTIRFVFPEGFSSSKVQCNITGIVDSTMQTRVFPQANIYDCLNVKASLSGSQNIILSGVVNPQYEMQMEGLQVQIIQPNNLVILEKVDITNQPKILAKTMNTTITIPNKFRNNTLTYIFEINMDSNLVAGDYMELRFAGNWTFFLPDSRFIEGIDSNYTNKAKFQSQYNWPTYSKVFIRNFSQISKESQTTFYLSLRTPLTSNFYNLTITAFKANGKVAQWYTQNLEINQTTGYIKEMKLHPMNQAIKLPVGQTGPLEITLALRNNLPKTNVLTHGKIVIDITPHIPLPDVVINGVVKCYFYGDIPAKNCTYTVDTSVNPTVTHVIAYTPVDFNFQSSQIPFMVTTEGFQTEDDQGLTIDTLVKRYHFHIQFYTDYSPIIPTEVIFTEWVADAIPLSSLSCSEMAIQGYEWSHLKCVFTTPNQILNDGHIHIIRVEFSGSGWQYALGYTAQSLYPDYPCLVYGTNVTSVPYPKCDLYTYYSNQAYKSDAGVSYINIYGIETIPANSIITMEFPKLKKANWYYASSLNFSILQDTYGYETHYIGLYSQTLTLQSSTYVGSYPIAYTPTAVTVTMTDSVVNKVGDITLTSVDLNVAACDYVIFEVEQSYFPDIGRSQMFTCGSHKCSKFNKPIQYFIVYPQTALARYQNFVFPSILNPAQAGDYTFYLRAYKGYNCQKKISFTVTVTPDTLVAPTYTFASYETITQMYPNTNHFYKVSWTLKNKLAQQTSYILVQFDNIFTLSTTYCDLTTTAQSWDGKGIECQVWKGSNKVYITNMKETVVGETFTLVVQMTTSSSASSLSPTVSVYTYNNVNGGSLVDQVLNAAFSPTSITNTNLQTMATFDFSKSYEYLKPIKKGYFGDLILNYDPGLSTSNALSVTTMVLTFTSQFYPYSNSLNLPLSCKINNQRFPCSYTLAPFEVTITNIQNVLSASSNNVINITTEYLQRDGIYFPSNQGRYLLKAKLYDVNATLMETNEKFIDIKPLPIQYFNVTYAHRDANLDNIYIAEFQNGNSPITAYNDGTNASRIYIGFPRVNSDGSGTVFLSDLGFSNGTVIPCYFQTGPDYVTPVSGKKLGCRLRRSTSTSVPTYVQIINFDSIPAGKKLRVFMGKIKNPASKIIDMNFNLKVNYFNPTTYEQTPQYENEYNLFIDMLDSSISTPTAADKTSQMFQAGAKVGDLNKFINHVPLTMSGASFAQNDWFIVVMNSQFPLNGILNNCINNFYKYCIVYPQINWVAIKINNGTLIPFYPQVTQMPLSISRVDTYYQCYTWKAERWTQTITYTITASDRWMELRGAITGFNFQVLGSQNKLNIGQKNVDVLVSFTVAHKVPVQGTIQIKFPNDSTKVPSIKPHCRSAVSMGSQLYGMKTGKPATNKQGQIGCLVQNSYSWLITSYDELPAGSTVMISGVIDFPTVLTSTLGTGYVVTYTNEHATNVFANGRVIDYLSTNFPLQVENKTWSLVQQVTLMRAQPLRVNHVGKFEFKLQMQDYIRDIASIYTGYIDVNFWRTNILGFSGGFTAPAGNTVCSLTHETTGQKFACYAESVTTATYYISYRLKFYYQVNANTPYIVSITTQNGNSNEGINYPSVVGTYKIETQIMYYTNYSPAPPQVSKAHFIEVYGPKFNVLNLVSSVNIPAESNLLLFEIIPSSTITSGSNRLIIEIPTISNDGVNLFEQDLGMGYRNYDDLVFDLYDSSITSMKCKVHNGNRFTSQPVKIICNQFSLASITTLHFIRFGFWVKNPNTALSLAIPIQVYIQEVRTARKLIWQMLQAGVRVIPTSVSPINDFDNFVCDTGYRQVQNTNFRFTNRNTKPLQSGDYYILKFNFDLRNSDKKTSAFKYPYAAYTNSGDAIFLRNCKTILLRVGAAALSNWVAADASQSNKLNVQLANVMYNPATKLTTSESQITAYAVYLATQQCEKIIHKDAFPTLVPNEPVTPDFTMTAINSNLLKGQYQDYKFTFRINNDILTDTSLVKKISIQFPPTSTYDFKFRGQSCIQDPGTTIEIKKCIIDTSSSVIWIDPVQKQTYVNSDYLAFQTVGLAVVNPYSNLSASSRMYLNTFVIKYYTWADDSTPPLILATSDDYCFMKQDATYLSNTAYLTYSTSSVMSSHHDSVSLAQEIYVQQFLPLNTDVGTSRGRVPIEFKFIAMTTFPSRQGTANYHSLKMNYGSYYTVTAQTRSNDLYRYVPVCQLNGYRILDCTINTGTNEITMNFQQALNANDQVSVKFSVLDPVDSTRDGFVLASASNPIITLPVYVTPYGGTSYYFEPQSFSTYYKSSGISYPSMGISSVTLSKGTQVYSTMNYLDFVIQFSRSDVNGLVLEIPLVQLDGSIIYSNSKLLGLQSGAEYPCSVGHGMNVFCYYERGQTKSYGKPTRIYISRWAMPASNTLSFRMLFTNPDIVGVYPSFHFKAYGGTIDNSKFMGEQFMGEFRLSNAFKTLSQVPTYYSTSSACSPQPDKRLYSTSTNVLFYIDNDIAANKYVMLQWTLHDTTYGETTLYTVYNNTNDYDYMIVNYAKNNRKLYVIKKMGTSYSGSSSSHHDFGYLRTKHFLVNNAKIYYFEDPYLVVYTCTIDESWHNTYRDVNQYTAAISYLDLQDRRSGNWGWQFLSIDLGSTNPSTTMALNSSDSGQMIVVVKWISNVPYSALSSSTNDCSLQDGLRNTNIMKPITCTIDSANNEIVFKNVNKFTGRYVKFYYYAQTLGSNTWNHRVQIRVYANNDAYTATRWEIFSDTTGYYTMDPIYLAVDPNYSRNDSTTAEAWSNSPEYIMNHDTDSGHVQISYLSSSRIDFTVVKGATTNFPNYVYKMSFRFYVPRLSFSGTCSVLGEPVSRSGRSCTPSGGSIILNYTYFDTGNSHDWPTWSAGQTYSFSFSLTVSGQLNADYLFASMAYSWYVSIYYNRGSQCGACACHLCPQVNALDGSASRQCRYTFNNVVYSNWYCDNNQGGYAWYYYSYRNCRYYICRWYWQYGGQFISGKTSSNAYYSTTSFLSSYYGDLISYQYSVETQLMVHFSNFNKAVGPSQQSYLMFQFQSQSFPSGNPFPYTTSTEIAADIDCKCLLGSTGSISETSSTSYLTPKCVRFLSVGVDPTVAISLDISVGQDLRCYFPGFKTTSSGNLNIDIFIQQHNYHHTDIPRAIWSKYSTYNQINSGMNSYGIDYGLNFDDTQNTIYENNFWAAAQTTNVRTYQLNFSINYYEAYPEIYMSMYAPMPVTSFCNSGSFSYCRVYDSFINRRYFVVAKSTSNYISSWTFSGGSAAFPPSFDLSSSFYNTLLYVTQPSYNRYLSGYSNSRSSFNSIISPSTNTKAIQPSMFGSFLETYNSSIVVSVYLAGKKFYAYTRDYGQYQGSFIKVTFTGFTNLKGCSASLKNRPINMDSPLLCQVISNSQINVFTKNDLTITDFIYFTVYTAGLPSSSTYTVELFDKYMSSSNYARSFAISGTFGRSKGGYTTVDPTQISWRRTVYKEYQVTSGPVRFSFKNNYEYISDYNETSFSESPYSDAIVVQMPSGFSASDSYVCYAKEYLPGKKSLYKSFQVPCGYWSYGGGNKVHIKSLPSYSFKPIYNYEFVIYRHTNSSTMLITLPTSDVYSMQVISSSQINSQVVAFYDYFNFYKYKNVYPAVLNNIYILTKEAAANNSLYIDFTLNIVGTTFNYFEFEFSSLGLSSFKIDRGQEIPCYLSAQFTSIGGKTQSPRCFGYTNGIGTDSPLIVRVFGMSAWTSGTNFKIAFDNFNNPAVQTLFLVPIDIMFRYIDRTNRRSYDSYWPSVYVSDSINMGSPTQISGSLSRTSNNRGASNTHYISIGWPYSSSSDTSQKIVLKLAGGITCCQSFSSMSLRDNYNTYTLLWQNTKVNVSVYLTPSYSAGTGRDLWITSVNNPYPYQRDTYQKLKKLDILFYSGYRGLYSKRLDQFSFSSYSMYNQFTVDSSPTLIDSTKSFYFHDQYPMTYRFSFSPTRNEFNNRQLSYTILTFTSGVTAVDWAHAGWTASPYYFNNLMQVTYGKNVNNQWYVNISGMSDSSYWSTQNWYVEVKFLTNSNTVSYTSQTYGLNAELQFTNSQTLSISGSTFQTSPYAPTALEIREKKYFKNFFELQRVPIYAKSSNTASKLQFRFTTPYSIINQQTITLLISDSTELYPVNSPSTIYCLIRKTITNNLQSGISRWAPCTYTTGKYVITNPTGDLSANTQYTLTILERNQTGTSFKLPTQPKRIQVSHVYTSQLNLFYGDVYELDFAGRMNSITWTHASVDMGALNMIGINFNPQYTLSAASLVSPVTQTVLELQIYAKQFDSCLGAKSIYTTDGAYFASGTYFSHYSSPAVPNANTRLKCGQYSESLTPIKLTTTDYGQVTANNPYYFRYPLIQNPSAAAYIPFIYKFRLLEYKNGVYYPNLIGYYEYEGLESTRDGNSYGQTGYISASNAWVQSTMTLTYTWPNFNQGSNSETWIKWKNNEMQAITDISSFSSITTSNYQYQFYPNVNLLVYLKSNNNDDRTVNLLTFPTNDDVRAYKISWVHLVYTDKVNREVQTNLNYVTSAKTSWDTGTFALVSGLKSTNSQGIFRITWKSTSLRFLQGSYMVVQLSGGPFIFMDEYCKTFSGFVPGSTLKDSNLVCRRTSSTEVRLEGYQTIAAGTTLSIDVYLKVNTNTLYTQTNARVYIQAFSKDDKAIIQAYTNYLASYSIVQGAQVMKLQDAMRYKYMKGTARSLFVQFKLASNSLGQSQYVQIDFGDWQIDTSSTGKVIASYKVGTNYYYIPAVFTVVSGNKYRFGVYKNVSTYTIPANTLVTLKIDHINPDNFYGVLVPNIKWNYIKISAYNSGGTILEHQYAEIWIEPYNHLSFNVQPALDYSSAVSVYEFSVTPNVSISAGEYILLEFATADGLYTDLFSQSLGFTISTNNSLQISCRQTNNAMIISDSNIKCELFKGDISAVPSVPTTIQIKVGKNIAANQLISFNILSLTNPIRDTYPIGVTLKLAQVCYQQDQNRLCSYYKSTKYISFKPSVVPPLTVSNFGSLSFNPNIVSATSSKHTVSAGVSLAVGDFVKLIYYPQVVVGEYCTLQGGNGVCYAYPLENTIVIKASLAQSGSYSFVLTGMTNLYQYSGNKLYSEVWQVSTRTIIKSFYTSYTVPIITSDPVSTNALSIAFTPTLTPNYQLSYNFDNIAKLQLSYMLQNDKIQQILITAPSGITLSYKYCNATLQSTVSQAKPYPFRFKCQVISTSQVRITKNSDFPAWVPGFINKNIIVYLMYTISTSLVGDQTSNWVATTFTDPSSTSTNLRVSEGYGKFYVQIYQSPYIYKIDFFTYSFTKRICQTGQKCMFYGYLLPSTPQASYQIKYFDYTIPNEFMYSNLLSYDSCDMKQKNSDSYTFGCTATRNNSKVTIRVLPVSYTFNHNYKLLKIDNKNATRLFTAPQYPGSHYQMKVDLYTNSDLLIESQYINLTSVYGKLLTWNDIIVTIPQDASTIGIFEFTFKVGAVDIEPAYESSSTNRIVSAIEIIFSNSFQFDLGTGKKAGQQVACLPILNLSLKTMGRLTCRIYPSYSTITNPTIIVTGYDKILKGQIVTFTIAGIKSLPVGITDYVKIGVSYKYYDYGNVKGYIYEPTGKVVGPVTAPNVVKNIDVTVTQTSTNFVGELVNYSFTCTFTAGFAPVTSSDYVGIEFPQYGFEGRFSLNPNAKCSSASSQQCLSFGVANVIYFKPATTISSTTLSFTLTDNINTAFSFDYKNISIRVFTVINNKIDSSGSGSLIKFSKPSTNISGLITKTDSIYGGQSGISYYMDFKLGTYLPEYGKISVIFPSVYSSLFDLSVSCSLSNDTLRLLGDSAYCQIVSSNQMIISPNGVLMDKDTTYTVTISNLTNPNANITSNKFTIQSFYSSDIYDKQIISQNVFSPPQINVVAVKSCQFDLTIETTNQNYKSFYSMAFICPSVIKQASRLQVFLPWNLTQTGKQLCTSESSSLYSYQCSIINDYINNTLVTFMEIYLREHVPQKLIQIKGEITNGVKGVYQLTSSISYKNFIYLTGQSNKIYIDDQSVKTLTKMEILVQNYPYNRNYESLYTFKMTNPKILANSLRIEVPSTILSGPNGITCNSEQSSTNKDYFSFLSLLNTTELSCSMSGQSILINGLVNVIKGLKDDEFLFIDVFGLKNPDVSVNSSSFKFTFLNLTENTGNAIGTITQLLPYRVSQSPLNMQISSIALTSSKLQVLTNYSIMSSSIANNLMSITAQSDIGVKIKFPSEYSLTWAITPQPSQVKIYFGSSLYTATNIYMVQGLLMARVKVNNYESFSSIKVEFIFRNANQSINCTANNFVVSLFDFRLNSILAQTVGDNAGCINLSDKLFWIKVSGNSEIRSGNFSTYTIELQKPAKYLRIRPVTTTSAISFSPSEIIFQNYTATIQQFKIVSSPGFTGSFLITFTKQQIPSYTFYNDIKNESITLVAPLSPYMINFEQTVSKSIGQSIESYINIQVPSPIAFGLLHSNNCSSKYDITPTNRITIPAGASQVSFAIKYKGDTVPSMCMIKFEISSLTNINYALATNVLYLSGQPSIDRTNSLRPMILRISKQSRQSKDVGTSILSSDKKSTLKPMIYELNDKNIQSNQIQLQVSLSEPGFIYYAAMQVGTEQDKVTQKMIFDQNITTGVVYNKTRATISTIGSVNILTDLYLSGLEADKRYLIGVYLNSTVGLSDVKFKEIQTQKSSNGAVIKICFNSIEQNSTIMEALSTILRLKTNRLSVFTMQTILLNISSSYSTQVMNSRRYIYEVVLAPNRFDDSIKPLESFTSLISSKDLQTKVKQLIPSFDLTYSMTTHELILAKPKIRGNGITVQQLTDHNVRVSVQFWQVAYVYGVIVPKDTSKPALLTKQIIDGINRQNIRLDSTYRVSTQTDSEGVAILEFRLLSQKTDYEIFITAECVLPYTPRAQLSDSQVLKQTIKTNTNLNVANNGERIIEQLKAIKNDQLAQAVKEHILSVQQKKVLNEKVTRIRKRK